MKSHPSSKGLLFSDVILIPNYQICKARRDNKITTILPVYPVHVPDHFHVFD